jgi:hypothetical protein
MLLRKENITKSKSLVLTNNSQNKTNVSQRNMLKTWVGNFKKRTEILEKEQTDNVKIYAITPVIKCMQINS